MFRAFAVLLGLLAFVHSLVSTQPTRQAAAALREPLGTISFPNSGAPAAQADFIRGVARFWRGEEAIGLRAAQKIDRGLRSFIGAKRCFNQPLVSRRRDV
jgi:hypothetical protein